MSNSTFTGKIHVIEDTKTYGQKGFRKRLVVLEQDSGKFTNFVPFEFVQDACDQVDDLSVGDELEMTYRLSGRKWQKDPSAEVKFFLNAEAVSFKKMSGSGAGAVSSSPANVNDAFTEAAGDDDAPF